MSYKVTPAADTPILFGESPLWDDRRKGLIFIDQVDKAVGLLDPVKRTVTKKKVICDPGIKTIQLAMPYATSTSKFLCGTSRGDLLEWEWPNDKDGNEAKVLNTLQSKPASFYCDGKCDSKGRFWGGTFVKDDKAEIVPGIGGLHRFQKSGGKYDIAAIGGAFDLPNGLGWNKENTKFYLVDLLPKEIYVFDFNASSGTLANRKTVFDFKANPDLEGLPDGLVNDVDGNIWVACVKGGALVKIDVTTGKLITKVKIPTSMPTSMCFGGEAQNELFVTTCAVDFDIANTPLKGEPDAGKLFSITNPKDNSFKGFPHYFFHPSGVSHAPLIQ